MIRLKSIASLVTKDAKVIDIGTDHAYLPIYLYENNITKDITASDISENVLKYSKKNLEKKNLLDKIRLVLSDGFKNIDEVYDEAIIAGMGTNTIIDILSHGNIPNSLIICSHNNLVELREFMMGFGYKIDEEIAVLENNKWYDIIKYKKGNEVLDYDTLFLGKSNNIEYFNYLLYKEKNVFEKSKDDIHLKNINIIEKKLDCLK